MVEGNQPLITNLAYLLMIEPTTKIEKMLFAVAIDHYIPNHSMNLEGDIYDQNWEIYNQLNNGAQLIVDNKIDVAVVHESWEPEYLAKQIEGLYNQQIYAYKNLNLAVSKDDTFFKITSVHRDDLEMKGYDADEITDQQMKRLASKMSDDYTNQLFWISLDIIADCMGLPKKEESTATIDQ